MAEPVEIVERFYRSIQAMDNEGLLATLAGESFVGEVTAGLPVVGGTHRGAKEMLRRAWGPAHALYRVDLTAEEILDLGGGRVLGLGRYEGCPPSTEIPFTAAFAHVFEVEGDRIVRLRQITDSATWAAALHPGGETQAATLHTRT
jgi:ketosteroid isomerase-like protein